MRITVLFNPKKITILYTMYPFWVSKNKKEFHFTTDLEWVKKSDKNKKLLLIGWFSGQDHDGLHKQLLEFLSDKYDVISFMDDNDGTESHYLDLLGYFKVYYKKQIFVNRENYLLDFYGNRIFTDFYRQKFGINEDPLPKKYPQVADLRDLKKIKVSWNLAFGQYPVLKHRHYIVKYLFKMTKGKWMHHCFSRNPIFGQIPSPGLLKCQARFGYKGYRESIGYQRKLFLETVSENPYFLSGQIPFEDYSKEIKNVRAILSPFGWGEICFRDFEAILNGAVMVKPNMDHVETWPNVYLPNQTYLPVEWDGSNIGNQVETLFDNSSFMNELRVNAWETLKNSYADVEDRIRMILEDFKQ